MFPKVEMACIASGRAMNSRTSARPWNALKSTLNMHPLDGHIEPGEEIGGAHRGDDHDPSELEMDSRLEKGIAATIEYFRGVVEG